MFKLQRFFISIIFVCTLLCPTRQECGNNNDIMSNSTLLIFVGTGVISFAVYAGWQAYESYLRFKHYEFKNRISHDLQNQKKQIINLQKDVEGLKDEVDKLKESIVEKKKEESIAYLQNNLRM